MALRIKDNVDLKELENYGMQFKPDFYKEKECYVLYVNSFVRLSVNIHTRLIRLSTCKEALDLLFDLITAGLVEKFLEE